MYFCNKVGIVKMKNMFKNIYLKKRVLATRMVGGWRLVGRTTAPPGLEE